MTSLYSLRSTSTGDYAILKLDEDLNPDGGYVLSSTLCTCPAGAKSTCRHRKMLPLFLAEGHVDDGWMLEWETRLWRKPPMVDGIDKDGGEAESLDHEDAADMPVGPYPPTEASLAARQPIPTTLAEEASEILASSDPFLDELEKDLSPTVQGASPPPAPAPEAQVEPRVPVASGAPLKRRKIKS